jgi:chemotaxis protein methyltransferase CheR
MAARAANGHGSRKFRIWSAGCSTGEEAYSIAMTLDAMGIYRSQPDWLIEIVGTDLNTEALDRARRAVYTERAVRHVQGPLLDEYFVRDGRTFVLKDSIKARVTFEFGNLARTPMPVHRPAGRRVLQERGDLFSRRGDPQAD